MFAEARVPAVVVSGGVKMQIKHVPAEPSVRCAGPNEKVPVACDWTNAYWHCVGADSRQHVYAPNQPFKRTGAETQIGLGNEPLFGCKYCKYCKYQPLCSNGRERPCGAVQQLVQWVTRDGPLSVAPHAWIASTRQFCLNSPTVIL